MPARFFVTLSSVTFFFLLAFSINGQEPVFRHYQRTNGLKSEYINHIFQDSKGFIWISSDKGLSRYDGKNIFHLNTNNGLPANMVYEIWEEKCEIYFNVYEKGIFAWNGKNIRAAHLNEIKHFRGIKHLSKFKKKAIYQYLQKSETDTSYLNSLPVCSLKDYENNEWVGVFGKGLFRFIPYLEYYSIPDEIVNFWQDSLKNQYLLGKKGIYIVNEKKQKHFIPLKDVRTIDFYQGKFYLASLYNYYTGISAEQLFGKKTLPSVHCTGFSDMLHLADTRWIATFGNGLLRISNQKTDTIDVKKGLVSNNIERLQKTHSALWASTYGNGVSKISFEGQITNFSQSNGLLSNIVYYVFEDTLRKEFWIATERGISIFDELNKKKTDIEFSEKVLAITQYQGIYRAITEKYLYEIQGEKAIKRAGIYIFPPDIQFVANRIFVENEKIYIIGLQGLSVLYLDRVLSQKSTKPHFQILELTTKEKILDFDTQNPYVQLHWQDNYLKISLATLSFLNESENTLRYRIKDLDTQWTEPKPIREIILADLDYRIHTLEIQMFDANKEPSDIKSIRIFVRAPFWHTWWFRTLVVLTVLAMLVVLVRYLSFRRLKNKLKQLELQQKIQEERERIARDLHDNVGSQLTYIITDLEHISENIESSLKTRLEETAQFARQTINQLRETIWAIHQASISAEDLETKIRDLVWQYTKNFKHIKIQTQIDFYENFILNAIQALNIYRILQEALNNAFKHSLATKIHLQVQSKDNWLKIEIQDNGIGFDVGHIIEKGHYGITNIHKRAEEIQAKLHISSSAQGTSITLLLKI